MANHQAIEALRIAGVRSVRLQFSDLHGVVRGREIPIADFPAIAEDGTGFVEAVMTVVLVITFAVLTIKLLSGNHQIVTPPTVHHGALVGSFVLEVTVALSLAISWASYASDYSRYLPPSTPRKPVFWYSLGGIVIGYIAIQAIGIAGAKALGAETAVGVRDIMGGGFLGALALLVIALASVGSNVMNDYSGSLANPIFGIAATNDGAGYLLAARNGQVFAFGTARAQLCNGTPRCSHPVVAIASDPAVARNSSGKSSIAWLTLMPIPATAA